MRRISFILGLLGAMLPEASLWAEDAMDTGTGPDGRPVAATDHQRFRGGISLETSFLTEPDIHLESPTIDLRGELGGQINDLVGVYAVPVLGAIFMARSEAGPHVGGDSPVGFQTDAAVLVDFTVADRFTIGFGPDGKALITHHREVGWGDDAGFGGLIHLGFHPYEKRSATGPRRQVFTIGLDTRLLADPFYVYHGASFMGEFGLTVGYGAI